MTTYGFVDRFNHWFAALFFVAIACAGWALYFDSFERATAGTVRDLHKAFGTLIGCFAIWRVGARIVRGFRHRLQVHRLPWPDWPVRSTMRCSPAS